MKYLLRLLILALAIYAVWYVVQKNDKPYILPPDPPSKTKPVSEPYIPPPEQDWGCDPKSGKC